MRIPRKLVVAGMVAAILPDADVITLRMGIPYGDAFGHRGASHALLTAALIAILAAAIGRRLQSTPGKAFLFVFFAAASHGLLDTLTNGGHGVALLWPWSAARFFAAFRPIEVSPIGISGLFSTRGVTVLGSELLWIWLPCVLIALVLRGMWFVRPGMRKAMGDRP
jgi:inner membrane protein